jgi:hypothetical protein
LSVRRRRVIPKGSTPADEVAELLRTLLIVQLRLAGLGYREIRAVAGCDINRVNKTLKPLKSLGSPTRGEAKRT